MGQPRGDPAWHAAGSASGTADQNSGPRSGRGNGSGGVSAGYFGRVAALIKRNVVFDPTSVPGNPEVIVKIETSPDGTIVGTPRIVKSSGNPAWDDADKEDELGEECARYLVATDAEDAKGAPIAFLHFRFSLQGEIFQTTTGGLGLSNDSRRANTPATAKKDELSQP